MEEVSGPRAVQCSRPSEPRAGEPIPELIREHAIVARATRKVRLPARAAA